MSMIAAENFLRLALSQAIEAKREGYAKDILKIIESVAKENATDGAKEN